MTWETQLKLTAVEDRPKERQYLTLYQEQRIVTVVILVSKIKLFSISDA